MKKSTLVSIEIKEYEDKIIGNKTVTFYKIDITDNTTNKNWTIEKRFSDFKTLHDSLKTFIPDVPQIPSITLFKVTSPEALQKRKEGLETFLKQSIKLKHIFFTNLFLEFLDIIKNSQNIRQNDSELFFQCSKIPMGIRDFYYYEKMGVLFACCSDMNVVSRADSIISNIKIFGDKQKGDYLPLGAFFIYQFEKNFSKDNERFIVHKIWAKTFHVQTGCLFFNEESELFGVGLDDGKICIYKDPNKSHFVKSDLVIEISGIHKARVTGMAYDNKKRCLYTCANDCTFFALYLRNNKAEPVLLKLSQGAFTNLYFDEKNFRIILTNALGEISVFNTSQAIITEVANIQTSPLSCIRAIDVNLYHNYIFTGTVNGKISISNLGMAGKERLLSEISSFGGLDMKIRVCSFYMKRFELITGDETGRISVWDLKRGTVIRMWIGHTMAITQMYLDESKNLLYTGSKDKLLRVWKLPESWVSEYCDDSKIIALQSNTNENLNIEKLDQEQEESSEDSDDSERDDLNGWDFRKK
ncbi:MAG: hypothetical protein MJ252_14780 [archaeon]|nr:hypothetical protein [archaeon]